MGKKPKKSIVDATEFGRLQFTEEQVATMLGEDALDPTHRRAYLQGQLMAEAEVRRSVLKLARQGSSPAQKEFLQLVASRRKRGA